MIRFTFAFFVAALSFCSASHAQFLEVNDQVQWNKTELDTARHESYLSAREKDMIREINMVRADPQRYVSFIKEHLGNLEKMANNPGITGMRNGKRVSGAEIFKDQIDATNELIAELTSMKPARILQPLECIYKAAVLHGNDCKARGMMDHYGSDGSTPFTRIPKQCGNAVSEGGENITGGPSSVRQSVINLLVDAGIPSRGHRRNILDPTWQYGMTREVGTVGQMPNNWLQNFGK